MWSGFTLSRRLASLRSCRPAYPRSQILVSSILVLEVYEAVDLLIASTYTEAEVEVLEVYEAVDLLIIASSISHSFLPS